MSIILNTELSLTIQNVIDIFLYLKVGRISFGFKMADEKQDFSNILPLDDVQQS